MQTNPLPKYDSIALQDIPKASGLLFYGGPWVTEWYALHRYHFPVKPAAFHAALYLYDGISLNVGQFKELLLVASEYQSTRRIDVVIYKSLTDSQREQLVDSSLLDADKPHFGLNVTTYGIFDFLRFEPLFRKFIPADKRHDICSENYTKHFNEVGFTVSDKAPADTAPWDLYGYALAHKDAVDIRTLWTGLDFKV